MQMQLCTDDVIHETKKNNASIAGEAGNQPFWRSFLKVGPPPPEASSGVLPQRTGQKI